MKKTKLIALFLLFSMLVGVFSACGPKAPEDGGEEQDGDSWADFGGQEVKFCISVNQYEEANFPAADIYTKGPDDASTNEVAKEVLARNAKAEEELNLKIVYVERDLRYTEILEDVTSIVMTSAKDSPDIYNNDLNGLSWSMANGYFWNVKNPGDDVTNYFDFTKKGWYEEYTKCMTFDQEKLYIVAGDYFIDMIRMAWVVYVNHDILEKNSAALPTWAKTVDEFYAEVEAGSWDLDNMMQLSAAVHADDGDGITDRGDSVIGLSSHQILHMVLPSSSGITLYYLDKENGYKPSVMSDIDQFQKLSNKYNELKEKKGVYFTENTTIEGIKEITVHFASNKVLFATQRLGEMESDILRSFSGNKGLVPIPKWNSNAQDEYHTVIHNQVELAAILNTAHNFSAASALLQHLNTNSGAVVNAYYEKGLKYKYNSDKNARNMMDLIRECTDDPFSFTIGRLAEDMYTGTPALKVLNIIDNQTVSSTFASEKDSYVDCMNKVIEKFKKFD